MSIKQVPQALVNYLLSSEQQQVPSVQASYDSPFQRLLVAFDREKLMQSLAVRDCVPGEAVFFEGDESHVMYIIWSGRVAVIKGPLGSPTILGYEGAGEIIGEMSLLEDKPCSATVIALEQTRLLSIDQPGLQKLLVEKPSVSLGIIDNLNKQLREANQIRSTGELSEKMLIKQVTALQSEKLRLEQLQRLRQETGDLIIHDLRNPLNAITIALKMLAITLPENILRANQEILEVARVNCERMQHLVVTLLEVSQLDAGEAQFYMSEIDLPILIQEVVDHISVLERGRVELLTHLPDNLPHVIGDRDKIERVVINLLENAIKFSPDDGKVVIRVEAQDNYAAVAVSDDGPGIPIEDKERIFERFSHAGGESKRRGFGLGLAYCRLAIQGHRGQIWVEPGEDGTGSCFIFTLPFVETKTASAGKETP
jgi:signal transduction histidine kinase